MPQRDPKIEKTTGFDFLYLMCNNPDAIKSFYGDILGLEVDGGSEVEYVCVEGPTKMIFFKGDYELPIIREWAWQPGNPKAASGNLTSWSIRIPQREFANVISRISHNEEIPQLQKVPEWRRDSYWAMTVRDPMGNTIEVYSVPDHKPASTMWKPEEQLV